MHFIIYVREAGFEPAHPEIVGLKSTALDHSAIRAKWSCHIFIIIAIQKTTKVTFTLYYNYSF